MNQTQVDFPSEQVLTIFRYRLIDQQMGASRFQFNKAKTQ